MSSPIPTNHHHHVPNDRILTILYATETGTAQEVADQIARACRRIHIRATVHAMDAYVPTELISESLVVFVISTTGTGKEPRMMTPLWTMLLRSDLPEDLFEDLDFAVFGLGDTAYEKFCWPAKLLSRRLAALGAQELLPRGEGDEQHHLGIDGALGPWVQTLESKMLELYPLPSGVEPDLSDCPPRVSISTVAERELDPLEDPLEDRAGYYPCTLKINKRITATDWYQDVRHFEFEVDRDIDYAPGDVAVIHPEAMPGDVEMFLACVGYANTADEPIEIKRALLDQSLPEDLPQVTTLREVFTRYLDINAVPRRSFFAELKRFVSDDLEREKLEEFLSEEGADDLYDYCLKPRRTIKEVFEEFRSARIPRDYIFNVFPPLRPREFSIASSFKRHPRTIQLCIAIVQYKTMLKIPRRGVCTTFLAALNEGYRLQIGIRKGLLVLPENNTTPVICVGPGTGVAPMRAVIEQRVESGSKDNTLYFGCRSANKDQHYGDEWAEYASRGELTYRAAFSRDGPEGKARIYVQDLMREDAKRIWELVGERGACVYISGSSNKMPAAVRDAIRFAVETEGGKTDEEAREYVAEMEREGRLIEECWS